MKENRKAYASLCSAMLIFGTIAIFRRNIPFSSGLLAFSRGLLGGVFLLIFVAVKHHRMEKVEKKQLALLILSGAIIGVDWILLFEAYNCTTVAVATMCFYMQPTIVILLSPVLFREKLSVKKGLCALAAILGMVFVSGVAEGAPPGAQDAKGIAFGLAAAVLYAATVIINKKIKVEDAYEKTIVQLFFRGGGAHPVPAAHGGFFRGRARCAHGRPCAHRRHRTQRPCVRAVLRECK